MRILGIETSADETGVALIEASGSSENDFQYKLLGNAVLSQADLHAKFGGIFPNLAKREHGRNLVPVLMEALRQADELHEGKSTTKEDTVVEIKALLSREEEMFQYIAQYLRAYGTPSIDAIAVTQGPGLEPALWVGINFAKSLARVWNKPIVAVNHLEGHILIARAKENHLAPIDLPTIALLVSGGHTELALIENWQEYKFLGSTRDDAAGEAFDKTTRIMGLAYPGGPEISRLAREAREKNYPREFQLPRPMITDMSYDFSFSGLKTAVKKIADAWQQPTHETKCALAREAEDAITEVLLAKTSRAVESHNARTVIVGGGVSANDHLRKIFAEEFADRAHVLFPTPEFATDNAAMIALAGYFKAEKQDYISESDLTAQGNLRLV